MATYEVECDSLVDGNWTTSAVSNLQSVRSPSVPSLFSTSLFAAEDDGDSEETWTATLGNLPVGLDYEIQSITIWCYPIVESGSLDVKLTIGSAELFTNFDSNGGYIEWQSHTWSGISIGASTWNGSGTIELTAPNFSNHEELNVYSIYFEVTAVLVGAINDEYIPFEANSGARMKMYMNEIGSSSGVRCGGHASTEYSLVGAGGVLCGGKAVYNLPYGVRGGGHAVVTSIINQKTTGGVVCSGRATFTYDIIGYGGVRCGGRARKETNYTTKNGSALVFHLTGTDNSNPDDSIGGSYSSTIATRVGVKYQTAMNGIQILDCSHDVGSTVIQAADSTSLCLGAGTSVTAPNHWTVQLEDGNQWVRVKRTSSAALSGETNVILCEQFNNVFGGGNWEDTDGDILRASIIANDSPDDISSLKIWITPLTSTLTCVSGLSSSGNGNITAGADAFLSWDWKGTCRIENSGGTLKEIVHYYRADNDTLHVVGRGACGTSATAGSAGDKLTQVSPVRIGTENVVSNAISVDASGVSFSSAISAATGLNIGTFLEGARKGLWIQKDLGAAPASPEYQVSISYSYTWEGIDYSGVVKGLCRNASTSLEGYEIHIGVDEEPDLASAPDFVTASLPFESDALTPDHEYHVVTNYRNKWDLVSENTNSTVIVIDDDGGEGSLPPTAPIVDSWIATGSTFTLFGHYEYMNDSESSLADRWKIYVSYDGTSPLSKTPTTVMFSGRFGSDFPLGMLPITWVSGSQSVPTTAKLVLRVANGTVESTNTDVHTVTSSDVEFAGNHLAAFFGNIAEGL